jgi:hypothetical protein
MIHSLLWVLSGLSVSVKWTETREWHAAFVMSVPAVLCLLVSHRVKREKRATRLPHDAPGAPTPDSVTGSADSDPEWARD